MRQPDILLTPEERLQFEQIVFDPLKIKGPEEAKRNGDAVAKLFKSLKQRNAIPAGRIKYFTDAMCNPAGRGKSRQGIFEKNGKTGDDIFYDGNFLRHFSYFIFGPDLPDPVLKGFRKEVDDYGPITSGDPELLGNWAKLATRTHHLEPGRASEEFYKLAIECGLSPGYAATIRDRVR